MTRLIFTVLKNFVDDLKIGFRNWFYSACHDLVNTSASAPPAMGGGGLIP